MSVSPIRCMLSCFYRLPHEYIYIYIYIYVCMCECVYVCNIYWILNMYTNNCQGLPIHLRSSGTLTRSCRATHIHKCYRIQRERERERLSLYVSIVWLVADIPHIKGMHAAAVSVNDSSLPCAGSYVYNHYSFRCTSFNLHIQYTSESSRLRSWMSLSHAGLQVHYRHINEWVISDLSISSRCSQ